MVFEKLPLQDQVYRYLYRQILDNAFEKNVLYSESDLAKTLDVSRTPIHAALARLQKEGFVDILSSRGFQLHSITAGELAEEYQSAVAEEAYCVYRLMSNPRREAILSYLEADIREHEEAEAKGDIEGFIESDTRFHRRFFEASGNSIFLEHYVSYRYRLYDFLQKSVSNPEKLRASIEDHKLIVEMLKTAGTQKEAARTDGRQGSLEQLYELLERHHNDFA